MAYISPIEITFKRISEEMTEKQEGLIMQAIFEQGIKVNKDELLKALMYDRQQYDQGYADGIAEARTHGKWIYKCCYGDEFPQCSVCGEINDVKSRFCPDCGADMRGEE